MLASAEVKLALRITIRTFKAMSLKSTASWFQYSIHLVVSLTNFFPTAPLGNMNKFLLQNTISS